MKQKDQKMQYPAETISNVSLNGSSDHYNEFNFLQVENDGGYYYEFDEEYESYNSDYDLNMK